MFNLTVLRSGLMVDQNAKGKMQSCGVLSASYTKWYYSLRVVGFISYCKKRFYPRTKAHFFSGIGITKKVRSGMVVTYHDSDRQEAVPGFRQL